MTNWSKLDRSKISMNFHDQRLKYYGCSIVEKLAVLHFSCISRYNYMRCSEGAYVFRMNFHGNEFVFNKSQNSWPIHQKRRAFFLNTEIVQPIYWRVFVSLLWLCFFSFIILLLVSFQNKSSSSFLIFALLNSSAPTRFFDVNIPIICLGAF